MLFRGAFWAGAEFFGPPTRDLLAGAALDDLLCFCTGAELLRTGCCVVFFLDVTCRVCRAGATATLDCCLVLLTGPPGFDDRLGALACDADRCLVP